MTHDPDESHDPLIDARYVRGAAFHFGNGDNKTYNHFHSSPADPDLPDDLHSVDTANEVAAYELFTRRSPRRKAQLLTESRWAGGFLEREFSGRGAEHCAELLRGLGVDRADHLLAGLPDKAQGEIMFCMALRLLSDDVDDARARVREWARSHPVRAAQLLGGVAWLRAADGRGGGPRHAIELLPDGPSFLLHLPPATGAMLLTMLLPQPGEEGPGSPPVFAKPSDVGALLTPLVEFDIRRTAVLMTELAPWQAAGYLRQLHLEPGARLLAWYIKLAPTASSAELCQALPRPTSTALLRYINSVKPNLLGTDLAIPRLSGWPRIDALLALSVCVGQGVARLAGTGDTFLTSVRREGENLGRVWRAARQAVRDVSFYRRQRNHLAILACVLTVAVLLLWAIP